MNKLLKEVVVKSNLPKYALILQQPLFLFLNLIRHYLKSDVSLILIE